MKIRWDTYIAPSVRKAIGQFIHDYADWTWWVGLTFSSPVSRNRAHHALRLWLNRTAREVAHDHFRVAWGFEGYERHHPHFHVLLALPQAVRWPQMHEARRFWTEVDRNAGFTEVQFYNPKLGAAWYLTKDNEWDWGTACPRKKCCRKRYGCVVAAPPP